MSSLSCISNVVFAICKAAYHSIPFISVEGTQLFMSVVRTNCRTRFLVCLHLIRVAQEVSQPPGITLGYMYLVVLLNLLRWQGFTLELLLVDLLKVPKEMEVESSDDCLLAPELVHVLEAAYKVYGPALSQLIHPTMRTALVKGERIPHGLWVWHADNRKPEKYVVLYYLHGGGYCFFDGLTSHLEPVTRMVTALQDDLVAAGRIDYKVVAFILDYSLAPKEVLPTQVEEAVAGYKWILSQKTFPVRASEVVVSGDSAGGALTLSLLKCFAEGAFGSSSLPRPVCAHVASPMLSLSLGFSRGTYDFDRGFLSNSLLWYCASCSLYGRPSRPGEHVDGADRPDEDTVLVKAASEEWQKVRGSAPFGKQERNPFFSFDYCDGSSSTFAGVPILVQAGGCEGFISEILAFVKRMGDGVALEVYEDRFHVFPTLSWMIPQGKMAIAQWASFATTAVTRKRLPLGHRVTVCSGGRLKAHPDLDWSTAQSA
ncbi:hypothetical protein FOL47_008015 [Perkinsus chesapeaki]|uniref:Alpha/beta hydrolase fold-3 domain-containing protein n=1 Tax=Perkinsus chesapeaki TaxID=330153 RepID=A0A7J6LGB8_PERCH|nr:hypothetical protein FOL47_008015 [Perkinsus chesapeaki]